MALQSDYLTSVAVVTSAALACGLLMMRLRQPAAVGYILAGIVLGPTGLAVVSHTGSVQFLAELGVIMLLFLIGIELPLKSFKAVYKTAVSMVALQLVAAFAVFWGIGSIVGWNIEQIIVFTFATALSSTAVSIKILEETGDLHTQVGRTSVSVLIAQDLAIVPMMLIVSAFGAAHHLDGGISMFLDVGGKLLLSIGVLVGLITWLSRQDKVVLPFSRTVSMRPDVQTLAALTMCLGAAAASGMMGLSTAYGAFVSGLLIGNSSIRADMHKAAEPVQAILLMIFFLSIGLLIDLNFVAENWQAVVMVLAVVTVLKTIVNVVILHFLGEDWDRAFHSGVVLAQVGEFSFVICAAGLGAHVIQPWGYNLMITVIALSLLISPMWLAIARRLHEVTLRRVAARRVL